MCRLANAVIAFLVKEEIPAAEIHQRLQHAYGSVCMGASSVGNTSIEDEPRNGHSQTASTECNKERMDEIIQDDRRVTVDTIAQKLGIGHSAVQEMIESLGYRKVCARWVPLLLAEDHKEIAKMGWEVLPHRSYSPDLAPSSYHLSGFVKDRLRGRFETREAIQKAVRQCLRKAGTEFYRR
ncbi:hypothetical protein B7P43_G12427 [Cryptotermes secundus]|uniref:Mos1 transposase HTH domain-containing protein n=1 Tax=Cryptotermes secundus TaxID=105785 RepID=A0A2J7PVL0_9NEOP|nr:hypothetical protein B7P43_G12427 [Cryptotermes secundus]